MESRTMKILMIDDNQDNLTILKTLILESFPDASVLSALNGQRGLELAASEEPDIILLDIIMPGLDGYEVCRKLKDDAKLCDIPVVFVTAIRSNKESRIRALECGAEAFLTKPIDDIELTAQIRAMFKIRTANIRKRDDKRMLAALVNEKTKELKDANAKLLKTVGDLKNEQALLDAIFDSIPGYLYLYDERGKLVKWNKKHETMTGYSTEELADMSLNKWFDQEDIQKVNAAVKDIFETGYGEVEAQLILKSGAKMLVRSSGVPLVLNGQKYFAGIGMNITEQKRVEKALLESQRIAHLGTWSLDLLTNQVVWSEELYKMYGFDPSLPPPPYTEHMKLFTPESWIELSTALEHARTTGIPYELELKTVTADGSNGWMWVRGEAKTDSSGKIVALWGAAQDITARKQAEETLQESEEANKLLLDHLHVGIVLHNPDSSISFCNPLASELLGLSTNQMQSKLVSDKAWCFYNRLGEPLSAELYPFSLVYRDKELINYEMGILQEREKGIKWILVNGFAIPDKSGNLEKILISFIDITDKKQSEEAALVNSVKFQSLFDEMTSGAAIYDVLNNGATGADYIIKDFNKVALKAEGKEKREVLGKSLCELRPNIDQYGLIPVFQKVWQTGQPAYYPSKIYIDEKFSNWYENHADRSKNYRCCRFVRCNDCKEAIQGCD